MTQDLGVAYIGPETLNPDTLPRVLDRLSLPPSKVAIDTETVSLKDRTCIGIGVALQANEAIYFRTLPDTSPHVDRLISVLCNPNILKIYHNALFDLNVLTILGSVYGWPPIDMSHIADTSTMARIQGLPAALGDVAQTILGIYLAPYEEVVPVRHNSLDVPWSDMARKCLDDCMATYRLYPHLY